MIRFISGILILSSIASGQEDLLSELGDEPQRLNPVIATFKATRIVNAQSVELTRPKTMEFMIQHRFGSITNGVYDLFGMDGAVIRFDLKYGLNDWFSFGGGRSSLNKVYDLFSKIKILKQIDGTPFFPISVVLFGKIEMDTQDKFSADAEELINRITYDFQVLAARKMNESFSIQLMPTWVHRNFVLSDRLEHDLISLGAGGRVKVTKRVSVNADTFFPLGDRNPNFVQSWGLGCDVETGGHVFQLMITNAQGAYESSYVENATGKFENNDLYLGFNITRVFSF